MSRKRVKLRKQISAAERKAASVYDRRSADLPINALVRPVEVDDPYEAGGKIVAFKSIRDDPLGRMRARGFIDDAQERAGDHWRDAFTIAELGGGRAIDFTKEAVDGGRTQDPFGDRQAKAFRVLDEARKALDHNSHSLIRDVLGNRLFINQVAAARGIVGERATARLSRMFRDALETLAVVYGFAMRSRLDARCG